MPLDPDTVREGGSAARMPPFPRYLLPNPERLNDLPFPRRRRASSASAATSPAPSSDPADTSPSPASGSPPPSPPAAAHAPAAASATSPSPSEDAPPREPQGDSDDPSRSRPPAQRLTRTGADTLRCIHCSSELAYASQIISKGFTGRFGRAYLVSPAVQPVASAAAGGSLLNVREGRPENRQLVTGWHTVADISCAVCGRKLGWKYVDAREAVQKYKIGKYILETERVVTHQHWGDVAGVVDGDDEDGDDWVDAEDFGESWLRDRHDDHDHDHDDHDGVRDDGVRDEEHRGEVEFDSDDSEECEDLFAAVWNAEVVAMRRGDAARRSSGAARREKTPRARG